MSHFCKSQFSWLLSSYSSLYIAAAPLLLSSLFNQRSHTVCVHVVPCAAKVTMLATASSSSTMFLLRYEGHDASLNSLLVSSAPHLFPLINTKNQIKLMGLICFSKSHRAVGMEIYQTVNARTSGCMGGSVQHHHRSVSSTIIFLLLPSPLCYLHRKVVPPLLCNGW